MTLRGLKAMASRKSEKGGRKKDLVPKRLFKRKPGVPSFPPGTKVLYEPAGHEKMSEVLEDFIEPFQDLADNEDAYRKLLSLAMVAWNAALLPEDRQRAMIDKMIEVGLAKASRSDRIHTRKLVEIMVQRKQSLFVSNKRMIISFELTDTGSGYNLSVMSTLEPQS